MDIAELLKTKRQEVIAAAEARGAHNIRVFGSVARGEADSASDIDFLVDLEQGRSLMDLGGLLMDLRDILGVEVDVVTPASLSDRVRAVVLKEAKSL